MMEPAERKLTGAPQEGHDVLNMGLRFFLFEFYQQHIPVPAGVLYQPINCFKTSALAVS
jgi:hypothetical protein